MSIEDIKHEKMQELYQEYREGARDTWIDDNKDDLMRDFIQETHSDEFEEYCREAYEEVQE